MTTLLVADYDEAITYYCDVLGLNLAENEDLGGGKRWVVVAGPDGGRLLLAKASGDTQRMRIGDQTGGRVGFFLETDDFAREHAALLASGVRFLEVPRHEGYGTVAQFEDHYGTAGT
jgi:catechol 2,3-dioxygenase-like lactoylglutathione lyase family enzyme